MSPSHTMSSSTLILPVCRCSLDHTPGQCGPRSHLRDGQGPGSCSFLPVPPLCCQRCGQRTIQQGHRKVWGTGVPPWTPPACLQTMTTHGASHRAGLAQRLSVFHSVEWGNEMAKCCGYRVVHNEHEQTWGIPTTTSWASSKIPLTLPRPVRFHHGLRGQEVPGARGAPRCLCLIPNGCQSLRAS